MKSCADKTDFQHTFSARSDLAKQSRSKMRKTDKEMKSSQTGTLPTGATGPAKPTGQTRASSPLVHTKRVSEMRNRKLKSSQTHPQYLGTRPTGHTGPAKPAGANTGLLPQWSSLVPGLFIRIFASLPLAAASLPLFRHALHEK